MNAQVSQGQQLMTDASTPLEGTPMIAPSTTDHPLYEDIVQAIRSVYDPEIPVNIYDLGLIYTIDIKDDNAVHVIMTLTAPGCPVARFTFCPVARFTFFKRCSSPPKNRFPSHFRSFCT